MSEERYDLKESKRSVGELYPVLKDAHGNVIDGFHRLEDVPTWKQETKDQIKTRTQLWLARIIANTHRRQVSREERAEQFAELAEALMEENNVPKEKIIETISELTTFSERYVRDLITDEYKRSYTPPDKSELSSEYEDLANMTVPAGMSPLELGQGKDEGEATLPWTPNPDDASLVQDISPEPTAEPASPSAVSSSEPSAEEAPADIQAYVADVRRRLPGADEEWLIKLIMSRFHVSESEAREEIRRLRGQQTTIGTPVGKPVGKPVGTSVQPFKPETPQTTRCPLCHREGADKNTILSKTEELGHKTLLDFITEAMR